MQIFYQCFNLGTLSKGIYKNITNKNKLNIYIFFRTQTTITKNYNLSNLTTNSYQLILKIFPLNRSSFSVGKNFTLGRQFFIFLRSPLSYERLGCTAGAFLTITLILYPYNNPLSVSRLVGTIVLLYFNQLTYCERKVVIRSKVGVLKPPAKAFPS